MREDAQFLVWEAAGEYQGVILTAKMFVRFCVAKIRKFLHGSAFESYAGECLRLVGENTARAVQEGKFIPLKWADIAHPESGNGRQFTQEEAQTYAEDLARRISGG